MENLQEQQLSLQLCIGAPMQREELSDSRNRQAAPGNQAQNEDQIWQRQGTAIQRSVLWRTSRSSSCHFSSALERQRKERSCQILVTGKQRQETRDKTRTRSGSAFFTTPRTREGNCLRALEVRCAIWVLLIGEKNSSYISDSLRAA